MKRIVEFWAMVENHNLYYGEILVIDWNQHDKGFNQEDVVALCSDGTLYWVESAKPEEVEELFNFYRIEEGGK